MKIIFDIECDNLLEEVTKIHCLSYRYIDTEDKTIHTLTTLAEIYDFLDDVVENGHTLIGHNIIRYDIPVLCKILDVKLAEVEVVDTLAMSWYLYPNRARHGLEFWGDELNVPKPIIKDWKNLTIEEYSIRCSTDVEINTLLYYQQEEYLRRIYHSKPQNIPNLINYLNFKMECLFEQELFGINIDTYKVEMYLRTLENMFSKKTKILSSIMPEKLGKLVKTKPKKLFKINGDLTSSATKWFQYLKDNNLPPETEEVRRPPNPGSPVQLKQWLDSLGWEPTNFKVSKNTGENIPQVSLPFGGGICPSVKALYEVEPRLKELEKYYVIKHRIGLFKSYLDNIDKGKVKATAHGFTNTMRLTHSKPIVNLPKPGVFFGQQIREVLCIPNNQYLMCGSDVSSLEDSTKQHYIYFYDPKYVEEMRVPGFDPHIDIGVLAGLITQEEADFYKWFDNLSDEDKRKQPQEVKDKFKRIKSDRSISKQANFAATYGAGGPKIAQTAKIPLKEGKRLHTIYWKRNAAVKYTANACKVVQVPIPGTNKTQKWLFNPVSGFYMYLKAEKDRFSTLNQSTGVFVFDFWVRNIRRELHIPILMQAHDEIMFILRKEDKKRVNEILHKAMDKVNKTLKLNVEIKISVDFGSNYAEVH